MNAVKVLQYIQLEHKKMPCLLPLHLENSAERFGVVVLTLRNTQGGKENLSSASVDQRGMRGGEQQGVNEKTEQKRQRRKVKRRL